MKISGPPSDIISSDGTSLSLDSGYPLFFEKFASTSNTSTELLIPGDVMVWEARYTVTQVAINGGEISNYSTLETETLTGVTVSRTSNDGDDTDGEFDDVTKISILEILQLRL